MTSRVPLGLALLILVSLAAPAASASATTTGVDISRFDGRINWERVAGAGVTFAFVQASRGDGSDCTVKPERCGRDLHYETNYRNARRAGIRVGAYHRAFAGGATVADARSDARHEAAVFVKEIGTLRDGDLLPVLDVETPFVGLSPRRLRAWLHTWLDTVEGDLGVKPMIYTNTSSWSATGDRGAFARARYRLWVANWAVPSPAVPVGNWASHGWSVWQFTNAGHVPGIEGTTDMDRLGVPFHWISVGPNRLTGTSARRRSAESAS